MMRRLANGQDGGAVDKMDGKTIPPRQELDRIASHPCVTRSHVNDGRPWQIAGQTSMAVIAQS